jgi:DNA-binding MarR family transcriptional regulator
MPEIADRERPAGPPDSASLPTEGHPGAVMRVMLAIRAFSYAMDRMLGDMKSEMDVNATDLGALRMLVMRAQSGRSVSPHDLARHLRISTASTTKLLDRMEASGHLERRPHPSDRRARVVVLTEESHAAFHRHFGERMRAMRVIAERYGEDELDVIARFMREIGEVLDPPEHDGTAAVG